MLAGDILVPFKSARTGKSRLAGLLDDARRQALCVAMLEQTLDLAEELAGPDHIWLVSADRDARDAAALRTICCVEDGGRDLNSALENGRNAICARGGRDTGLLVLPTDLPFATPFSIRDAIAGEGEVIIVGDTARSGTNLLYLRGRAIRDFNFAFGPDSFRRHCDIAANARLRLRVADDPRISFDLDAPADYLRWQQSQKMPANETRP